MIRMSVLYPRREGARFDMDYYLNSHMPMVRDRLVPMGLVSAQVDRALDGMGRASPYLVVAHLCFTTLEDLRQAMSVHGRAMMSDVANYTDIEPVVQLGEQVFD